MTHTKRTLIEPFAGNASYGILHLLVGRFDHLILVELDRRVAAFWTALLDDKIGEELIESVRKFEVPLPDSEILVSLDEKLAAVKKSSKEYRAIRKKLKQYSEEYLAPFKEKMALLQHPNLRSLRRELSRVFEGVDGIDIFVAPDRFDSGKAQRESTGVARTRLD